MNCMERPKGIEPKPPYFLGITVVFLVVFLLIYSFLWQMGYKAGWQSAWDDVEYMANSEAYYSWYYSQAEDFIADLVETHPHITEIRHGSIIIRGGKFINIRDSLFITPPDQPSIEIRSDSRDITVSSNVLFGANFGYPVRY